MAAYRAGTIGDRPRFQRPAGNYTMREKHLWWRHRMTPADYEAMVEIQDGKCALCGADEPGGKDKIWHVDHDHSCCGRGRSCAQCRRGLLCNRCNQDLGVIEKWLPAMGQVLAYLEPGNRRQEQRIPIQVPRRR